MFCATVQSEILSDIRILYNLLTNYSSSLFKELRPHTHHPSCPPLPPIHTHKLPEFIYLIHGNPLQPLDSSTSSHLPLSASLYSISPPYQSSRHSPHQSSPCQSQTFLPVSRPSGNHTCMHAYIHTIAIPAMAITSTGSRERRPDG